MGRGRGGACFKGGGVHPPNGAEFLEAPQEPKKIFGQTNWHQRRQRNLAQHLGGGGSPNGAKLLKGALGGGGGVL